MVNGAGLPLIWTEEAGRGVLKAGRVLGDLQRCSGYL